MTTKLGDIAHRAVACPGWRWMPGMRWGMVPYPGSLEVVTGRLRDSGPFPATWEPYPRALPDITDPATLGCLLALVREKHGTELVTVPVLYGALGSPVAGWQVTVPGRVVVMSAPTEAEALVAALEAAQ